MKQGWNILKLSDACTLTMGQSPISESYNTDGDGLPFFQGCSDFGKINPTIRTYCNAPTKIAEANDVLMSVRAPIGTLNIANVKCCIGRGLASFRATSRTTNSYLYYFLKYSRTKLESLGTGSTFKAIGKDALSKFPIPVPPIEEQKAICSLLDKMNRVIEAKKEQLKELDNLAQAMFYEMFGDVIINDRGWGVRKWNDCLTIFNGRNQKQVENVNGQYPICGSGGVMGRANQYITPENSVIVGRKGNINKPILMREKFWNVDTAFGIHPNGKELLVDYLYYFCVLFDFEQLNKAVTIPSLTKTDLLGLDMPVPPLTLQQSFAEKVEAIERQKELINQSIKDVQTLFDAKMDYYFGD